MHAPRRVNVMGDTLPQVGDLVVCRGIYTPVLSVHYWAAGTHNSQVIKKDWAAYEIRTTRGSRWVGTQD